MIMDVCCVSLPRARGVFRLKTWPSSVWLRELACANSIDTALSCVTVCELLAVLALVLLALHETSDLLR